MKLKSSQTRAIALALLIVGGTFAGIIHVPTASAGSGTVSFFDSFEDEAADSGLPDEWQKWSNSGEIGKVNVTTERSYDGSQSLYLADDDSLSGIPRITPKEHPTSEALTANVSTAVYSKGQSQSAFYLMENDTKKVYIRVDEDGYLQWKNGTSGSYENITTANNYNNEWVRFEVYDVNTSTDTVSISWEAASGDGSKSGLAVDDLNEGYDQYQVAVNSLSGTRGAFFDEARFQTARSQRASGRVVSCPAANPSCSSPGGVPDGTIVQAYGVRESNIDPDTDETLEQRATEIRNELRSFDTAQIGWDPDLQLTGSNGMFATADGKYVAVHKPEDWALQGWADIPDHTNPVLTAPSDSDIILSVRDPSDSPLIQDGMDSDLPGTIDDDTDIIIQQLDYQGSVVDERTVSTSSTYDSADFSGASDHDYARVNLPRGFYRVKAEGSSVSYVMTVGDPSELANLITDRLEDRAGSLSARAQQVQDRLDNRKVVKLTTTTYTKNGTQGHFNFTAIPGDVNVIAVQAYSPAAQDAQLQDPQNASVQDIRELAATDYNGSFYLTRNAQDVTVPTSDATVRAVEYTGTPFMDMGRFQNKTAWMDALLENSTFAGQIDKYLDTSDENMTQIRDRLESIKDQNQRLQDRYQELLNSRDESGDPNTQEQIRLLRQSIQDLEGSLQPEDPSTGFENGKASATIPWNGDVDGDGVSVTAHFPSLGNSQPVADEYISVDKRAGQGDVVKVENYPVPDGANSVTFGVTVNGEDGENVGNTRVGAKNPNFTGEFLNLKSMSVSTLQPGPNEQVTITPRVSEESALIQNISATVTGPDGNSVPTTSVDDGEALRFTTNGSGTYRVQMDITDRSGNTWSESLTMSALNEHISQPPSVRVREGFTGTFAVVSDGFTGGDVEMEGSSLTATGVAKPDSIPRTVHFYASEVSAKHPSATLRVMKASDGGEPQSIQKHATVFYHTAKLPEDTIIYRAGDEPLKVGGSTSYGEVSCGDTGCTVETYTDGSGTVDLTVNTNPSVVDRAIYWVRLNSPVDIPVLMAVPDIGFLTDVTGGLGGVSSLTVQFQFTPAMAEPVETASPVLAPFADGGMSGGILG